MAKREPNAVETTPSGIEIAFYDSIGVDGEPQQRRYLIDGERLPSVTTILGTLSKGDALLHWAVGLTRDGQDWREVRDEAARRGHGQHHLLLQSMLGERTSLSDLSEEYRGWGQAGFRWLRAREPKVIAAEKMIADPAAGYAGRFDLLTTIDGERTLTDFKTVTAFKRDQKGNLRPPYDENLLQLDLYAGALEASGYGSAERGLIVRLGPDGDYDETFIDLDVTRGLAVLAAYRAKRIASKAVRAASREPIAA